MLPGPRAQSRPVTDLEHEVIAIVLAIVRDHARADSYLRGGAEPILRAGMLRVRVSALRTAGLVREDLRAVWAELRDLGYLSVPIPLAEGDGVDSAGGRHDSASQRTVESWLFGRGGAGSTAPGLDTPTPRPGQLGVPYYRDQDTGVEYFWVDGPPADGTAHGGEFSFYLRVPAAVVARTRREQREGVNEAVAGRYGDDGPDTQFMLPPAGHRPRLVLNTKVYSGPPPPGAGAGSGVGPGEGGAQIAWIDASGWSGDARLVTARAIVRV